MSSRRYPSRRRCSRSAPARRATHHRLRTTRSATMDDASATEIGAWVTAAGLAGASEPELLRGFCERATAAGLPLARALVLVDTLHPIHEGLVFRWRRDPVPEESPVLEYGRMDEGSEHATSW